MSKMISIEIAPTLDTNAYADGDVLGTANPYQIMMPTYRGGGALLQSLVVRDKANQKIGIDFLFFKALPTGTYTNNAAFAIATADKDRYAGRFSIVAGDYTTLNSAFAEATKDAIGKALSYTPSETFGLLYVIPVIRGAGTYAAADLSFRLSFITGDRS